ncbi:MAG: vWA domain-containing protein [Endomicrobiia bacterium]
MGLSFLSGFFLYFLPLSFIPLILHLFFKRKPKHIFFSDLRFIKIATKNITPRKKIHQWLLLITRCLVLIFLCLAFIRPIVYISGFKTEKINKQLAILIDTSYSMGYLDAGKTRLDKAKTIAIKLIEKYSSQWQQICILSFSNSVEKYSGLTNNNETLKKFIQDISLSNTDTSIIPAINFIYKIFSEIPNSDQSIIILTDMGKNIIGKDQAIENFDPKIKIIFVDVSEPINPNVYIKDVSYSGLNSTFKITLFNSSNIEQTRTLSLFVKNKNIFDGLVKISPHKEFNYEIKHISEDEKLWGKVLLSFDNLPIDDVFYFSFPVEQSKKILVVDGDPKLGHCINSESYYLNTVLSDKEYGRFIVKIYNMSEFSNISKPEKYDVLFLCNLSEFNEKILENVICDTIFISLGDKTDIKKYPEWIRENVEQLIEREIFLSDTQEIAVDIFPEINSFDLKKISFQKYFKMNNLNSKEILKLKNGDAILIKKEINSKNVFIFSSSIDRDWTNFPSKPFYPYFIRIISEQKYIKKQDTEKFVLEIKEPIVFRPKKHSDFLQLANPEGKNLQPLITTHLQEKTIISNETDIPGIYELKTKSKGEIEFSYFAVNLPRKTDEGNLSKIDIKLLNRLFKDSPKTFIKFENSPEDTTNKILFTLLGRELTKTFFTIVLILLGVETIFSKLWAKY